MSIIVEDGTGLAGAESYISVADANAYHKARGNESNWLDLDTPIKEKFLRDATDYMVAAYRQRWKGRRVNAVQALDWPRYEVEVEDVGFGRYTAYLPSNAVPQTVKNACAALALKAKSGELAPDVTRQVKEKTIGPIKTVYADGTAPYTKFRQVDALLAPFLQGKMRMVRG